MIHEVAKWKAREAAAAVPLLQRLRSETGEMRKKRGTCGGKDHSSVIIHFNNFKRETGGMCFALEARVSAMINE